nr:unnamed protein product [Digitaria exilis]
MHGGSGGSSPYLGLHHHGQHGHGVNGRHMSPEMVVPEEVKNRQLVVVPLGARLRLVLRPSSPSSGSGMPASCCSGGADGGRPIWGAWSSIWRRKTLDGERGGRQQRTERETAAWKSKAGGD